MHDWQELARDALEMLGDEVRRQGFPTWIRVFDDPGDESGMRVEVRADPTGPLGWRAPHDCVALGVVATGRARFPDDERGGDRNSNSPLASEAFSLRMSFVIGRDQEVGWTMETPDGTVHREPPKAGRMLDVLTRCLGLPTGPPDAPPATLHSAAWLTSVIDSGLGAGHRLTWSDVERSHPLARLLAGDLNSSLGTDDELRGDELRELESLVRVSASAWSWEEIRLQAAAGELESFIDADIAAWMDEGMFSRWLLSEVPSIDQLLAVARPLLVPSAARRLAHAVQQAPAQPARSGTG